MSLLSLSTSTSAISHRLKWSLSESSLFSLPTEVFHYICYYNLFNVLTFLCISFFNVAQRICVLRLGTLKIFIFAAIFLHLKFPFNGQTRACELIYDLLTNNAQKHVSAKQAGYRSPKSHHYFVGYLVFMYHKYKKKSVMGNGCYGINW